MPNIEDLLQRAIREGKFNNLPGKGQPLRLDENPHADPEQRLANHLLQQNGFSLPWLELRQEIENEIESARRTLQQAWEYLSLQPAADSRQADYLRAVEAFNAQLGRLNQRISDYNLQVPLERFQMRQLNLQQELARLGSAGH